MKHMSFNIKNIRDFFPFLVSEKNINRIYFDNAATTHKPQIVIDTITKFYTDSNSNIHRSSHDLGASSTLGYEEARELIKDFISARYTKEIIYTSGATESINLVASSYKNQVSKGDIIFVSPVEHHANLIPWQRLAEEKGAAIKRVPIKENLQFDISALSKLLNKKVKLIAVNHVSNVTGIIQDIKSISRKASKWNIPVFVDGAQAAPHINIDVQELGCDFYCFSGHKLFGPTGTGVLFIKDSYLDLLEPYKAGGQMVSRVSFKSSTWAEPPLKFEAGTPNIAGVLGLGAAIKFIQSIGMENIIKHELSLSDKFIKNLKDIPSLKLYGGNANCVPVFSFNIEGVHHFDISTLLSKKSILIRSGELCNQSTMSLLNIDGCLRVSLSSYNTLEEIDLFFSSLKNLIKMLKP